MLAYVYKHTYLIPLLVILLLVLGSYAVNQLPVEYLPQNEGQSLTIQYTWSGQSPRTIESVITRKVEEVAATLRGVADISSQSRDGMAQIILDFKEHTPVNIRQVELKELLASLQKEFPEAVSNPNYNSSKGENRYENEPILVYSLLQNEGRNLNRNWIKRVVEQPLLRIQGVSEVVVRGLREPALQISVDINKVLERNLSYQQILRRISRGNRVETIGRPQFSNHVMYVKPDYTNLAKLRNLPVSNGSQIVRLSEVADITSTISPYESLMRMNGKTTITISIFKNKNTDEFNLAERIKAKMNALSDEYDQELNLRIERDITDRLYHEMTILRYQSIIGAILIFVILYLFLRNLPAAIMVYSSILLSVLLGFAVLYTVGFSVNLITLATLIVALGLIVDNSIIVFDHLSRKELAGRKNSYKKTADEALSLLNPILANTLTTLIIFLPIALFFRSKLTIISSIGISLVILLFSSVAISFLVVPYVTARKNLNVRPAEKFVNKRRYFALFHQLKHKLRYGLITLLILSIGVPVFLLPYDTESNIGSMIKASEEWIGGITYQFYHTAKFGVQAAQPDQTESITINIKPPSGSSMPYMDKMAGVFEGLISEDQSFIKFFKTQINKKRGIDIQVVIPIQHLDDPEPFFLFNKISYLANKTGNADITARFLRETREFGGGGANRTASVILKGYNYKRLNKLAVTVKQLIERMGVAKNVYAHAEDRQTIFKMELPTYHINSKKLTENDISYTSFINAIKPYIRQGQVSGIIHLNNHSYQLVSESSDKPGTIEDLFDNPIRIDNRLITLREFGDIYFETEPTAIIRENRVYKKRVAFTYLGQLMQLDLLIDEIKKRINFPPGFSIEKTKFMFGGEPVNPNNLVGIVVLTLFAIWVICSAALEHWKASGYILICLICTLAVCMAYTVWFQSNFNESHYTAVLFTLGIAVNNMLLLLFIYRNKIKNGVGEFRAWQHAFQLKSRPIIMTLFTTIAGLLPLLLFDGSQFWYALALMVIFTLPLATALTFLFAGVFSGLQYK